MEKAHLNDGYSSHHDYMLWVQEDADNRQVVLEASLRNAFTKFIEVREVEVVIFGSMSAEDLANAIILKPIILKPILAACNIGGRAIKRDLKMNIDTYDPRVSEKDALILAGYIKPFLPGYLELPALSHIDRIAYIDKEIRKTKGNWEKIITEAVNQFADTTYRKRKFSVNNEEYELDVATPIEGSIKIGIDIKRIEARQDIHKRSDEIVNKAQKFKRAFPDGKFGAVIYYPFIEDQINVQSRLESTDIDCIVFASDAKESIINASRLLLTKLQEVSI